MVYGMVYDILSCIVLYTIDNMCYSDTRLYTITMPGFSHLGFSDLMGDVHSSIF